MVDNTIEVHLVIKVMTYAYTNVDINNNNNLYSSLFTTIRRSNVLAKHHSRLDIQAPLIGNVGKKQSTSPYLVVQVEGKIHT